MQQLSKQPAFELGQTVQGARIGRAVPRLATRALCPNFHLQRKVKLSGSGPRMCLHDEARLILGWNNRPRGLFCRRSGRATKRPVACPGLCLTTLR